MTINHVHNDNEIELEFNKQSLSHIIVYIHNKTNYITRG